MPPRSYLPFSNAERNMVKEILGNAFFGTPSMMMNINLIDKVMLLMLIVTSCSLLIKYTLV